MDISRNHDNLAPGARLIAKLVEAVDHARMDNVPPEKIASYLRDLAQDVVEAASN